MDEIILELSHRFPPPALSAHRAPKEVGLGECHSGDVVNNTDDILLVNHYAVR